MEATGYFEGSPWAACYNLLVDISEVRAYLSRWDAVERVEREEALALTVEDRWEQLNTLYRLALSLGISFESTIREEEPVWQRWANIRKMAGYG